ncbi:M48 family metallopeptidase [Allorhodopirellula solitaria]|uniref:M48 family peptidase n=1 Tax=Allorhodopirellula solitaria TaxID=2527987 RepID=A0A5C5X184_9BACT|nr:M48 family metallopeptidase [Allorhodopirellula solitaria]TWT56560.1 M48 family peptidase [Allorhodopirellula solitaria]
MSSVAPTSPPPSQTANVRPTIDPRDYIAPGTGFHQAVGGILAALGFFLTMLFLIGATFGIGLVVALIGLLLFFLNQKKHLAKLHGSAIKVGPEQFPDVYNILCHAAAQMGMADVPEAYIYEDNTQNAAAAKIKGKRIVLLTDDMVYGALTTKSAKVLQFVIAHELAHHYLGHSGLIRSHIAMAYKPLSRLNEFTCDGVAAAIVNDQKACGKALALLSVGPQLLPKVNVDALFEQAQQVASNKLSKKSEGALTHPLLLRRFARVMGIPMKV